MIGRLAVDRAYASAGREILADALRRIALASQTIGIVAVLVQARDERAKRSYQR